MLDRHAILVIEDEGFISADLILRAGGRVAGPARTVRAAEGLLGREPTVTAGVLDAQVPTGTVRPAGSALHGRGVAIPEPTGSDVQPQCREPMPLVIDHRRHLLAAAAR